MWRKIHSNRDPRDSLYSELRKEFSRYFNAAGNVSKQVLYAYPKFFYGLMLVVLLASAVLSFTVFRQPEVKQSTVKPAVSPVGEGFSKILETAAKIKEGLRLKKVIDSLSVKKQLSSADSITLVNALDRLQQIQNLKP